VFDVHADVLAQAEQALATRRHLDALNLLGTVLKVEPTHRHARFLTATVLADMGRVRESIVVLNVLVEEFPNQFSILNNLAWTLATAQDVTLRDPARAVELARRAVLLAPDNFNVWSTLAEAHFQNGNYQRALRAAQEARRLGQQFKASDGSLVTYEEQVSKCQQAVKVFSLIE
jgi:Flp pilus assembly protein TadD